jgi:hypothetical protein
MRDYETFTIIVKKYSGGNQIKYIKPLIPSRWSFALSVEPLLYRTILNNYYPVVYTLEQNIVFGSDGINNKNILHAVLSPLCGIFGLVMIWFRSSHLAWQL